MPLITSLGLSNKGKGFPITLAYILGETIDSYSFFFKVLQHEIFIDLIPIPGVILSNKSTRIASAVSHGAISSSLYQLCN